MIEAEEQPVRTKNPDEPGLFSIPTKGHRGTDPLSCPRSPISYG